MPAAAARASLGKRVFCRCGSPALSVDGYQGIPRDRGSSVHLAKVFIFAYGVFLNCTTAEAGNGPIPYAG
eukprot:bmy_00864T0